MFSYLFTDMVIILKETFHIQYVLGSSGEVLRGGWREGGTAAWPQPTQAHVFGDDAMHPSPSLGGGGGDVWTTGRSAHRPVAQE